MTSHRRPDITARFRAIVARAIERADREEDSHLAALRATPLKRISLGKARQPEPSILRP